MLRNGFTHVARCSQSSAERSPVLTMMTPSRSPRAVQDPEPLLSLTAGLDRPTAGAIELDERPVTGPGLSRGPASRQTASRRPLTDHRPGSELS